LRLIFFFNFEIFVIKKNILFSEQKSETIFFSSFSSHKIMMMYESYWISLSFILKENLIQKNTNSKTNCLWTISTKNTKESISWKVFYLVIYSPITKIRWGWSDSFVQDDKWRANPNSLKASSIIRSHSFDMTDIAKRCLWFDGKLQEINIWIRFSISELQTQISSIGALSNIAFIFILVPYNIVLNI